MSLVKHVLLLGLFYSPPDARNFALANGVKEEQLEVTSIHHALNAVFEQKKFNTRCIELARTPRQPLSYFIVTNFAVIPESDWGTPHLPDVGTDEWTRRVCRALMPEEEYKQFYTRIWRVRASGNNSKLQLLPAATSVIAYNTLSPALCALSLQAAARRRAYS